MLKISSSCDYYTRGAYFAATHIGFIQLMWSSFY